MTEPEDFLTRWSRRKQEAANAGTNAPDQDAPETEAPQSAKEAVKATDPNSEATQDTRSEHAGEETPAFDFSSLPSIDSITAQTDIRAFLAPGVPAELARQALRRVWSADPKIRDFIEMAENQWDFNAPGIPGFDFAQPANVEKMVADFFGGARNVAEEAERLLSDTSEPAPVQTRLSETPMILSGKEKSDENASGQPPATGEKIVSKATQIEAAPQREENPEPEIPVLPRRHGSALPS